MVDFEQVAATLAAALIKPMDLTGNATPAREKRIAEAAAYGVAVYHAVLIELVKQQRAAAR